MKGRFKNLAGFTFNRLTVLTRDETQKGKKVYWICLCDAIKKALESDNAYCQLCNCCRRECEGASIKQAVADKAECT